MSAPFEDPAKIELRARCEVAIDQAGHEVVSELLSYDLPESGGLRGKIKGDLQSVDGDGRRHVYYVRPATSKPLPKWLANVASGAHEVSDIALYIVVSEASSEFIRSCRAAGAGLLILSEDDSFERELDFDVTLPEAAEKELVSLVDSTRRALESKMSLNTKALESTYSQVNEIAGAMDAIAAERYKTSVEHDYQAWSAWSEGLSARLDGAFATRDLAAVKAIAEDISIGPNLDSSTESATA